jgi:phenylacetate-coenzyme A ligase PaaK-like adenylate-forming protein
MENTIKKTIEEQLPNNLENQEPDSTLHDVSITALPNEEYLVFATSGTTGGAKTRIPMRKDNLDHYKNLNAEAVSIAGIGQGDTALNLGAPLPHISGWVIDVGMERASSGTANDSYEDVFGERNFENVLQCPPEEVTSVITLPRVALRTGESIEAKRDESMADLFPHLEIGIFSGDVVNNTVRENLKELYQFDKVVEAYAASECGFIAVGIDESSQMVPLINNYIFEIIPDTEYSDTYDEIIDIRDVGQPVIGELVLTDPYTEAFDFTRYLIGDKIKVYPEHLSRCQYNIPTIEFMGRSDEVLNFGGAHIHENQLDRAINSVCDQPTDWVISSTESTRSEGLVVDLYLKKPDKFNIQNFRKSLSQQVPAFKEVVKLGIVEEIRLHEINAYDNGGGMKSDRMDV